MAKPTPLLKRRLNKSPYSWNLKKITKLGHMEKSGTSFFKEFSSHLLPHFCFANVLEFGAMSFSFPISFVRKLMIHHKSSEEILG